MCIVHSTAIRALSKHICVHILFVPMYLYTQQNKQKIAKSLMLRCRERVRAREREWEREVEERGRDKYCFPLGFIKINAI